MDLAISVERDEFQNDSMSMNAGESLGAMQTNHHVALYLLHSERCGENTRIVGINGYWVPIRLMTYAVVK